ncbi:HesB/YadR/YfhF family protein [Bacillus inaquosorum]|nr:HesB/YadR/YfhF family protein [Bacillus inaquosorum]
MNMTINEDALNWYKEELDLESGDQVRFFVRYGRLRQRSKGFSLGVAKDAPQEAGATAEAGGITFFIEESDLWYFDNHDLLVSYSEDAGEPVLNTNKKNAHNVRSFYK